MRKTAVILLLGILSMVPVAGDGGLRIEIGASWKWVFPRAVMEHDRNIWEIHGGAAYQLGDSAEALVEYTFGGIIFGDSGHTLFHGPRAGLRYSFHEFLSAGCYGSIQWVESYRTSPVPAVSASVGVPVPLHEQTALRNELYGSYQFGDASAFHVTLRNALSSSW